MKKLFMTIFIVGIIFSTGLYFWQSRAGQYVQAREINPQELLQMIQRERDFYVYFFSPTCKDCIKSEPNLAKAVEKTKIVIVKLDVKKYESAREEFAVPGTPTLFHYKGSKLARGITGGYSSEQEYIEFFQKGGVGQ